jgi:hypothetical protein
MPFSKNTLKIGVIILSIILFLGINFSFLLEIK